MIWQDEVAHGDHEKRPTDPSQLLISHGGSKDKLEQEASSIARVLNKVVPRRKTSVRVLSTSQCGKDL